MPHVCRSALGLATGLAFACAVVAARPAAAQTEDLARAKAHFEAGRALYSLGNFPEALREFQSGYQLAPRPQFLLNIGFTFYKLHELEKARAALTQYVDTAPKTDGGMKRARESLTQIERDIAARPPAPPPPVVAPLPSVVPEAQRPPPPASTPAFALAPAPVIVATPPPKKSWIKRYWWVIPVSAAVVAGVAVGAYFGTRSPGVDCTSPPLGCLDGTRAR